MIWAMEEPEPLDPLTNVDYIGGGYGIMWMRTMDRSGNLIKCRHLIFGWQLALVAHVFMSHIGDRKILKNLITSSIYGYIILNYKCNIIY